MPRPARTVVFILASALCAHSAHAALFVVPSDRELLRRANVIVIATSLAPYSQRNAEGGIETVTPVAVEQVLKGAGVPPLIDVVEPGGELAGSAEIIPGVPQFESGRRMLLLLSQTGPSRWAVTELVLGKFTFVTDRSGRSLLVRDEDEIAGWDPDLQRHREVRRDAARFLEFVRAEVRGERGTADYSVRVPPLVTQGISAPVPQVAPYTATSYTMTTSGSLGARWTVFPNPVSFYRGTTAEPGAPNGGDTAINTAFASWNNDCASNVNYVYAGIDDGTHTQGLHAADGRNTILFERDLSSYGISPFSCSSNSYGGTLGIGGVTSASGTHTLGSETFATTNEGDVEMNVGIANCSLLFNNGDFNSGVTHEVGHTLGFRHSDQNRTSSGACSTDATLECSSSAIMTASVTHGLNGALQTWDQHAVQAVYPGNVCAPGAPPPASCTPPSITSNPSSQSITSGQSITLSVGAAGTAPLSYQWYIGAAGNTSSPIPSANSSSLVVGPTVTTQYWVLAGNACGSAGSTTATVTVNAAVATGVKNDFNGDGRGDLVWRNYSTGQNVIWFMNGASISGTATLDAVTDTNWELEGAGDLSGDGRPDLVWRNRSTGQNVVWQMNGTTRTAATFIDSVTDTNWVIAAVGDLNADGHPDLIWRNLATGQNVVWFMSGLTRTSAVYLDSVATNWRLETAGDLNKDGRDDLVWRDANTGENVVWVMNGATRTSAVVLDTVADPAWHIEEAEDVDGNGAIDLVWRNHSTGANVVWFMSGFTRTSGVALQSVNDLAWQIEDRN